MTTTAHEDQFTIGTQTIEPVRQPYNTVSILRRNIADMEVALRTQTERAEAAEAELEAVREDNHSMMLEIHNLRIELEQKPVAWMDAEGDVYKDEPAENWCPRMSRSTPPPSPCLLCLLLRMTTLFARQNRQDFFSSGSCLSILQTSRLSNTSITILPVTMLGSLRTRSIRYRNPPRKRLTAKPAPTVAT